MVFVKNSIILSRVLFGEINKEKFVFFYVLDRKEWFLD